MEVKSRTRMGERANEQTTRGRETRKGHGGKYTGDETRPDEMR